LKAKSRIAISTQFSQDGKFLFVTDLAGEVIVYETGTFSEITRTPKIESTRVKY